jgi:hypothetical protein
LEGRDGGVSIVGGEFGAFEFKKLWNKGALPTKKRQRRRWLVGWMSLIVLAHTEARRGHKKIMDSTFIYFFEFAGSFSCISLSPCNTLQWEAKFRRKKRESLSQILNFVRQAIFTATSCQGVAMDV